MSDAEHDNLVARCGARVGQTLGGKWKLTALIGVGGMAAVYAAVHRNGATSAIKILHPEVAAESEARERFLREAYIANKVGHPGAVSVLDDDIDVDKVPYLVMEMLAGESVAHLANAAGGRLPVAEVIDIADQALAVLAAAHDKGIVHRDIKPDNLFMTKGGQLKVLDFGIARLRESPALRRTATGLFLGTPAFMAPEQALSRWSEVDPRTDLWAVGATMFTLLTGRLVHQSSSVSEMLVAAATEPASSLARAMPSAPLELVQIVDKALEYDKAKRFPDAASMRAELARLARSARASAMPPREEPKAAKPSAMPPRQEVRPLTFHATTSPVRSSATPPREEAWAETFQSTGASERPSAMPPRDEARSPSRWPSTMPPRDEARSPSLRPSAMPPREDGRSSSLRPSAMPPREDGRSSSLRPSAMPPREDGRSPSRWPSGMPPREDGRSSSLRPSGMPPREEARSPSLRPSATPPRSERAGGPSVDPRAPDAEIGAMRELFALMEKVLLAELQYGAQHPETVRRLERLLSQAFTALAESKGGLSWSVNPYSFFSGTHTLWEPEEPFNRVPYRLFSDGVRVLKLAPGLTEAELQRLMKILILDPANELAPEDDLVTMLWDACFEHVEYLAIDSFSEGNQESRAQFERQRQNVVALAMFDTSDAIEQCWAESAAGRSGARDDARSDAAARVRTLIHLLRHRGADGDKEAAARAGRLALPDEGRPAPELLRLDPSARDVLAARMRPDTGAVGERFVLAAAHAYAEAFRREQAPSVTAPLRAAVDGLAAAAPIAAIHFVCALCKALDASRRADAPPGADAAEAEILRATLAGALVSKETMSALLTGAADPQKTGGRSELERAGYAEALAEILGYLDGSHVLAVLEALPQIEAPDLRQLLLDYVARAGRGHEAAIGALLRVADVDVGLPLVRVLVAIGSPAAREAISHAAHSPHPVVRIEALGHVEGVSGERLRTELCTLLEDREPSVRLAALRTMAKYGIRVAGPFLVLRVRSPVFDGLPLEERREALETLRVLAPARCEAVATELLLETRFLSSEAHEQTRELAAEVLGRVARGEEALSALAEASKKRFRGNDRVRVAAARALERVSERAAPPAPPAHAKGRT